MRDASGTQRPLASIRTRTSLDDVVPVVEAINTLAGCAPGMPAKDALLVAKVCNRCVASESSALAALSALTRRIWLLSFDRHASSPASAMHMVAHRRKSEDAVPMGERAAIVHTLKGADGNKVRAAKALGIAASTLYEKMRRYAVA